MRLKKGSPTRNGDDEGLSYRDDPIANPDVQRHRLCEHHCCTRSSRCRNVFEPCAICKKEERFRKEAIEHSIADTVDVVKSDRCWMLPNETSRSPVTQTGSTSHQSSNSARGESRDKSGAQHTSRDEQAFSAKQLSKPVQRHPRPTATISPDRASIEEGELADNVLDSTIHSTHLTSDFVVSKERCTAPTRSKSKRRPRCRRKVFMVLAELFDPDLSSSRVARTLLDTGANMCFVNEKFLDQMKIGFEIRRFKSIKCGGMGRCRAIGRICTRILFKQCSICMKPSLFVLKDKDMPEGCDLVISADKCANTGLVQTHPGLAGIESMLRRKL